MPLYRVPLAEPVPQTYADELAKRVLFVSDQIIDFTIVAADGQVSEILFTTTAPVEADDLARRVDAVVVGEILPAGEASMSAAEPARPAAD